MKQFIPRRIIFGLAMLLIYGACKQSSPTVATTPQPTVSDSIPAEKSVTPEPEPRVIVPQHFANSSEAHLFMNSSADSAAYARGILHQMANDYLPYVQRIINSSHDRFIIADKWAMKVRLFDRFGCLVKEYGMGCGKNYGDKHAKADSRTPEGFFSVENVYDSTDWLFTDDDGVTSEKQGQFGPRFIRLRIPGTSQIGIHGTCAPWTIGSRVSHGCMRIKNEEILELAQLVKPGMPVIVNPGRRDTKTNIEEGYDVPWISSSHDPRYGRPNAVYIPPVDSIATDLPSDSLQLNPETLPADTIPVDLPQPLITSA